MRIVLAAAIGVLLGASQVEAKCSMNSFTFRFGSDVAANGQCDAKGTTRIFRSGASTFDSVTVVQPPAHGRAHTNGRLGYGYRPAKGYHGPDSFVIRICGFNAISRGCSNLKHHVVVL
jgi:hypothetical protein